MIDLSSISEFKAFVFSDESIKTIVLFLAWDMRSKFKDMKAAVESLTVKLGALEEKQTMRFEKLEDRVDRIEQTKTQGG